MSEIVVKNLSRSFTINQKRTQKFGSIADIFSPIKLIKIAVNDLSFSINKGEFVGFIGPNGAGKTTTLKMLTGLLWPSSGTVKVLGHEPFKRNHDFLKSIALVMGQKNGLVWDLPVIDTLEVNAAIYQIPETTYRKQLRLLTDLLDAGEFLSIPVRQLSLGQRMKAELIAALLHEPQILFLDEPTIGLDLLAAEAMRKFLKAYNQQKQATIILTSHYMKDVEELCGRLIIIDKGKLLYDGSTNSILENSLGQKKITLMIKEKFDQLLFAKFGNVTDFRHPALTLLVENRQLDALLKFVTEKYSLSDLTIEDLPLEDTVKNIYLNNQV